MKRKTKNLTNEAWSNNLNNKKGELEEIRQYKLTDTLICSWLAKYKLEWETNQNYSQSFKLELCVLTYKGNNKKGHNNT